MLEYLPIDVQLYLVALVFAASASFLTYWFLYASLRHFLGEIFASREVEQFWVRVVFLVLFGSTLAVAVAYQPDITTSGDVAALIWNMADTFKEILDRLIMVMFALFLPLLASYTVLHVGRHGRGSSASPPASS